MIIASILIGIESNSWEYGLATALLWCAFDKTVA
jgi:hypothetical protein